MNTTSILCFYHLETNEVQTLARFDRLIEAPFYRGDRELWYNEGGRIYRMVTDSGEIEEIPTGACNHCNNDHVLSPDGKQLAISHSPESDWQSRIYIVGLDPVTPPRLITQNGPSYLHGWSPDGKTLAYCACRNGDYDVYTISVDGGEETRLTDVPGLDDGPEYAPDGETIWFNSVRAGLMECYRMDADGKNVTRVTDNGRNNWFPHISPDGKTVAYISYDPAEVRADDHPANKNVEIRAIDPDGRGDRTLVKFFGGQGSFNVNSWKPDGSGFAFVRYELTEE
ncbi:MAG: TolB family protein [Clostridia bacterium]|nr:TolB family protein [Clostridia bacterium]